jgi:hypothetical protein
LWAPNSTGRVASDLIATTGDYLRIWAVNDENSVSLEGTLSNSRQSGGKTM